MKTATLYADCTCGMQMTVPVLGNTAGRTTLRDISWRGRWHTVGRATAQRRYDGSGTMDEPQVLRLRKRPLDLTQYEEPNPHKPGKKRLRMAAEGDVVTLVQGSTLIYDLDEQVVTVAYLQLDEPADDVVAALQRIPYVEDARPSGITSRAKTIGYRGPSALRGRQFCSSATLENEDPEAHHTTHVVRVEGGAVLRAVQPRTLRGASA